MDFENLGPREFDSESNNLQEDAAAVAAGRGVRDVILQADAQNTIVLPDGVTLANLEVDGRDLVIIADDGTRYVIPEGAIIVPQIVVDGAAIPPLNLAALLVGNEPEPAAGAVQSSGGNFADPVDPIQDAYGLGDLLPYTELNFPVQEDREIIPQPVDRDPDVVIETPDNPVGVENAIATVSETGLPARGGEGASEPPGIGENADGNPANDSDSSETTTGTIVFNTPDGIGSIVINGENITAGSVGLEIVTPFGTMTITSVDLAAGMIGFSYTLNDNLLGVTEDGNFSVTVTDTDGDSASATLMIFVQDDGPVAVLDEGSVDAGTFGPIEGNVLDNDQPGADDYRVGGEGELDAVTQFQTKAADGTLGTPVDAGTPLQGLYGTLTVFADGHYEYTRDFNTPGGVEDTFRYTIIDQDGSTDSADLVITIENSLNTIDLTPATGEGTVVQEGGLPPRGDTPVGTGEGADGDPTNNSDMSETTGATVKFNSPDGLAAIKIDGKDVNLVNEAGNDADDQVIVDDETGTLVITSVTYDPATGDGTITYEYTLKDNTLGDQDVNGGNTTVSFTFEVIDLDGNSTADDGEDVLTITIIDDAPDAAPDSAGQVTENQSIVIDALANDAFGADDVDTSDATKVFVSSQASQGTVTYDPATGLFTYVPNPGAGSDDLTDSFQYTIIDSDGDSSVATVDLTLQPDSEPQGNERVATVDDDGLDGGNPASTTGDIDANVDDDPADTSEASFTGALAFDVGNDSPATVSIDPALAGTTVEVGTETATYSIDGNVLTATGPRGVLFTVEITDSAAGEYVITLVDNVLHDTGSDENNAFVSIDFIVADSEGETTLTNLGIVFDDDAPTATDNSNDVVEGGSTGGNLLTDDDGDGVDAAGADDYAAAGAIVAIASSNEGTDQTTVVGGELVIAGEFGTLTVNAATGAYTYVSDANSTNQDDQDVFTYTIRDGDGDESTATLTIDVDNVGGEATDDDVDVNEAGLPFGSDPSSDSEIDADGQIIVTGQSPGTTLVYTVAGVDQDADPDTITIDGQYGTLVLNKNTGAYTYTLDIEFDHDAVQGPNEEPAAESFDYQVQDTNGNLIASGTIDVNITDDVPDAVNDAGQSVAEDAVGTIGGNVMANDTEGADGATVTSFSVGGVVTAVPQDGTDGTYSNANGSYTMDMDGNWTFDPNPNLDQSGGDVDASFTYTITDGDLDVDTATQPISITDGADPMAGDPISLLVDDENLADGSDPDTPVTDSGSTTFTEGSDDIVSIVFDTDLSNLDSSLSWVRVNDTTITGSDGGTLVVTLTLGVVNNTATVTATLSNNYDSHPLFTQDDTYDLGDVDVVATDTDGDTASATVSVAVSDDVPDAVNDAGQSVAEDAVGTIGGNVMANDTEGADGATVTSFSVGGVVTAVPQDGTDGTYSNANGSYTMDMDGNWTFDPNPNLDQSGGDVDASFTYTITDGDLDVDTATQPISITDGQGPSVAGVVALTVDEAALDVTQDAGDLAAGKTTGTTPSATTESAQSGAANQITFTSGSDDITSIVFTDTGSISIDAGLDGAKSVVWALSNGDRTLTGSIDGNEVIILELSGLQTAAAGGNDVTPTVTVTLTDDFPHEDAPDEDSLVISNITVTASEADGDSVDGFVTVTVVDDEPTIAQNGDPVGTLVLDESPDGEDEGGNDSPAGRDTVTVDFSGNFTANFGADGMAATPITYALLLGGTTTGGPIGSGLYALDPSDTDGIGENGDTDEVGKGDEIMLSFDGTDIVGKVGTTEYFRISVDGDGEVTFGQSNNVWHSDTASDDDVQTLTTTTANLIQLQATAEDGDGDTASASIDLGAGVFKIEDDGPGIDSVDNSLALVPNTVGVYADISDVDFTYGTDGAGSLSLANGTAITGLRYDYNSDGSVTAFFENDTPGDTSDDIPYFEVSIDQVDGTVDVELFIERPTVTQTNPIDITNVDPGNYETITVDNATFDGGSFLGGNLDADNFTNDGSTINVSGNGFGIANNLVKEGKGFKFNYDGDATALNFNVNFQPNTDTVTIRFTLWNDGVKVYEGSTVVDRISASNDLAPATIEGPADLVFDEAYLSFDYPSANNNGARVQDFEVDETVTIFPDDQVISFDVIAVDADGDAETLVDGVQLTFQGDDPPMPPVVLDFNGDAADFVGLSANVAYDYDNDNVKTKTAWIAAGNAILAYDANGDHMVTNASEFVFGHDGKTDLEALQSADYDTNGDGKLDANDSTYGQFGVWLDDGDGVSEAGEFVSLKDAGITSVELTSDGNDFGAADGDVTVFGTASYTLDDGSTGAVYDAAFATGGDVVDGTMEALLAAAAAQADAPGDEAGNPAVEVAQLPKVNDVLNDVLDNATMDSLLDSLGATPLDHAVATMVTESGIDLLNQGLGGYSIHHNALATIDIIDDAAAMAANHA